MRIRLSQPPAGLWLGLGLTLAIKMTKNKTLQKYMGHYRTRGVGVMYYTGIYWYIKGYTILYRPLQDNSDTLILFLLKPDS